MFYRRGADCYKIMFYNISFFFVFMLYYFNFAIPNRVAPIGD